MTKRIAKNQMTKENWMNEDEEEEPGQFEHAVEERLQNRVIKKARRRSEKNGVPSSPFMQFAGLVGVKNGSQPTTSFSFLSQQSPKSNGSSARTDSSGSGNQQKTVAMFSGTEIRPKTNSVNTKFADNSKKTENLSDTKTDSAYLAKLKQLNMEFLDWVKENMNTNAYCDFTPVCLDYVEHMKKLEDSRNQASVDPAKEPTVPSSNSSLLGNNTSSDCRDSSEPKRPSTNFSFGAKRDTVSATLEKPFKVPPHLVGASPVKPFSFFGESGAAPSKPFTFSSGAAKSSDNTEQVKEGDGDEKYVPPKVEFKPVDEPDSLYSKRCKLFYKKDGDYIDKGVGTLHLKMGDKGKTQLFIREDTCLGKLLLNIDLLNSLPTERMGKNNVLIVCVPNPPLDAKTTPESTPFLLRVKTAEDADELFEKLNKYKTEC